MNYAARINADSKQLAATGLLLQNNPERGAFPRLTLLNK